MSGRPGPPRLDLVDSQSVVRVDLDRLRDATAKALPLCLGHATDGAALATLDEIEVAIVDDAAIARVHGEFLGDPAPTDVITFDHGEILASAETAARRAREYGNSPARELALYVVHGLLHLAGYRDSSESEFERMRSLQEDLLSRVW